MLQITAPMIRTVGLWHAVSNEGAMSVNYQLIGRTAVISLERQERRNAIDRATAQSLADAWRRFDADEDADVAILYGEGGHFSAGADLKSFDLIDRPGGFLGFTRTLVSKPTIAAIEGYCVAGGMEMALWCDLRVASRAAVFGCLERRYGVPLVDGGTQRLPRIVGMGVALEMILTGRPVTAEEALRIGLVTTLADAGSALDAALALAELIGAFPQDTVRSDRLAVLEGLGRSMEEGLEIERRHGLGVLDVARAGALAFAGESAEEPVVKARDPAQPGGPPVIVLAEPDQQAWVDAAVARLSGAGWNAVVLVADFDDLEEVLDSRMGGVLEASKSGSDLALVGYGPAGTVVLSSPAMDSRIMAVVGFECGLPDRSSTVRRSSLPPSYLGHYAEHAAEAPRAYRFEMHLRSLGIDGTFHIYRNANSGFLDPGSSAFSPVQDELAWTRTLLFLGRLSRPSSVRRPPG